MSKKIGGRSKINAHNDNDISVLSIHPRIVKIMIDNLILDFFHVNAAIWSGIYKRLNSHSILLFNIVQVQKRSFEIFFV